MRIFTLTAMVFIAGFLAGCLVSWLIEGVPYYRESAISGAVIAGLMAWQLHMNNKSKSNG